MADASYESAVAKTFIDRPLRTVLMIDDQFPTYADVMDGLAVGAEALANDEKFRQRGRALDLYRGFRGRSMICDIENDIEDVDAAHLRKSDLVILDYNLGPGQDDNDKSIRLLRSLSSSKHFNTVVVYTANDDQDGVWLDIIASMRGGWAKLPASVEGAALEHWNRLSDQGALPDASINAVMQFAKRGEFGDIEAGPKDSAQKELIDLGVPPGETKAIIVGLVGKELARRSGDFAEEPDRHAVGGFQNGRRWILAGNAFVVVMKKVTPEAGAPSETDLIMQALKDALLEWHPNIIQILISEVQNILELEALATEELQLRKPTTQTALAYYLLDSIGKVDPTANPDVRIPLMALVDKVVDGMRRRLSTDGDLLRLAGEALVGDLRDTGWHPDKWPVTGKAALINAAIELARTKGLVKHDDIMFKLNSFLSTEKFRRAHITTGTVFYLSDRDEYYIAASPACDLVARAPSDNQHWARSIHPTNPFVAIRLRPETDLKSTLVNAAQAEHIFLELNDENRAFRLNWGAGHQPSYEFFFARNEGRVREADGKTVFDAGRFGAVPVAAAPVLVPVVPEGAQAALPAPAPGGDGEIEGEVPPAQAASQAAAAVEPIDAAPDEGTPVEGAVGESTAEVGGPQLSYHTFEVVGQLRGVNATHVLQMVGQHLSRIGLDFMDMPSK
jgi:hypothetical protein